MSYAAKEVVRLAGRAVHQFGMIHENDRVLVGLSGGKDSLVLLDYLVGRQKRSPLAFDIVVAHLDMGYEDPGEKAGLENYVRSLGGESVFEDTDYGRLAHSDENRENPCFLCSRLRRKRLFEIAHDRGCGKVALGHHREDLIETLLINIFYAGEISTMKPVQSFFNGLLTVIRPLCMVPEEKVRRAAADLGVPVVGNPCPGSSDSKRREIQSIIGRLARNNDKIPGNMFRALSNWRPDYLLPKGPPDGRRTAAGRRAGAKKRTKGKKESGAMEKGQDQRKRTRVNFQTSVTVAAGDDEQSALDSKDLSMKGVYVLTDRPFAEGTAVEVTIHLSGTTSQVSLLMKGRVARMDKGGMGIDFTEIDMDSFYHLRNIVLYNTGDPSNVDNELTTKAF